MATVIVILESYVDPFAKTALGVVKRVISSTRVEEINGENTLDFKAVLDDKLANLLSINNVLALFNGTDTLNSGAFFDVSLLEVTANEDSTCTVNVEADHISYRLNNKKYNITNFSHTGSASDILQEILSGTEFSLGSVTVAETLTKFTASGEKSRRQLLIDFVATVSGELSFNNFDISVLEHVGSSDKALIIKNKDISMISKTIDRRNVDSNGLPTVTYKCTMSSNVGNKFELGDELILIHSKLNIFESLRVSKITFDPYDDSKTVFEFGDYGSLSKSVYDVLSKSYTIAMLDDSAICLCL